jgi:hypothetical protein
MDANVHERLSYITLTMKNSNGHEIHQYQQNERAPLILTELTEHKQHHDIGRWKSRSWIGTGTTMWQG